jgi:hypothetical protein
MWVLHGGVRCWLCRLRLFLAATVNWVVPLLLFLRTLLRPQLLVVLCCCMWVLTDVLQNYHCDV